MWRIGSLRNAKKKVNKYIEKSKSCYYLLKNYGGNEANFCYYFWFFFTFLSLCAWLLFLLYSFSSTFLFRYFPFALFARHYFASLLIPLGSIVATLDAGPIPNRSAYRTLISIITNENNLPGFVHFKPGISLDFSSTEEGGAVIFCCLH